MRLKRQTKLRASPRSWSLIVLGSLSRLRCLKERKTTIVIDSKAQSQVQKESKRGLITLAGSSATTLFTVHRSPTGQSMSFRPNDKAQAGRRRNSVGVHTARRFLTLTAWCVPTKRLSRGEKRLCHQRRRIATPIGTSSTTSTSASEKKLRKSFQNVS